MHTNIGFCRKMRQKQARERGESGQYTQQFIADTLGIPRSRVSMIENGQAIPTLEEVEIIANTLGVTVGHLITPRQLDFLMDQ